MRAGRQEEDHDEGDGGWSTIGVCTPWSMLSVGVHNKLCVCRLGIRIKPALTNLKGDAEEILKKEIAKIPSL